MPVAYGLYATLGPPLQERSAITLSKSRLTDTGREQMGGGRGVTETLRRIVAQTG